MGRGRELTEMLTLRSANLDYWRRRGKPTFYKTLSSVGALAQIYTQDYLSHYLLTPTCMTNLQFARIEIYGKVRNNVRGAGSVLFAASSTDGVLINWFGLSTALHARKHRRLDSEHERQHWLDRQLRTAREYAEDYLTNCWACTTTNRATRRPLRRLAPLTAPGAIYTPSPQPQPPIRCSVGDGVLDCCSLFTLAQHTYLQITNSCYLWYQKNICSELIAIFNTLCVIMMMLNL